MFSGKSCESLTLTVESPVVESADVQVKRLSSGFTPGAFMANGMEIRIHPAARYRKYPAKTSFAGWTRSKNRWNAPENSPSNRRRPEIGFIIIPKADIGFS